MFPTRYFPDRFFAPRYWPKLGPAAATPDIARAFLVDSRSRVTEDARSRTITEARRLTVSEE